MGIAPRVRFAAALLVGLCGLLASAAAQITPVTQLIWQTPAAQATQEETNSPAAGTPMALPLRWSSSPEEGVKPLQLRLQIALDTVPNQPWALLIEHNTEGGRYALNGHIVGITSADDNGQHVHWRSPTLIAIDPSVLHAGINELIIDTAYGPGVHRFEGVWAGPYASLWNSATLDYFASTTWSWISVTSAFFCAIAFGVFAFYLKSTRATLLAITAAFWALHTGLPLIEIYPVTWQVPLTFLNTLAIAGFSLSFVTLIHRTAGVSLTRPLVAYLALAVCGPILSLPGISFLTQFGLTLWHFGMLVLPMLVGLACWYRASQNKQSLPISMALASCVFVLVGLADMVATLNWQALHILNSLPFTGLGAVALLALPQLRQFSRQMRDSEVMRAELELRVKEREHLLKRNYERTRASERLQAESQERQRIMQDMHDGLGSQLLSALMLVERGGVGQEQFAQILRESIDDMRLAIDAMSTENADLAAALGNLRFRMEPRFRAANIMLAWDARRLPDELGLHSDVVLPVLRIVQESLTNALKHSGATAVRVVLAAELTATHRLLDVRISDNGKGITEAGPSGRGLLNMRSRAQKIGARIRIETTPNAGTTIHLRAIIGEAGGNQGGEPTVLNTEAIVQKARYQ